MTSEPWVASDEAIERAEIRRELARTDAAQPWAQFGWETPGLLPGHLAQLRRLEAAEAAQERREADERRARAEDRRDLAIHRRMQEFAFRGRPFNPADLSTLAYEPGELADRVFNAQDAENAHAERKALVDAGLLHLIDGPGVYPASPHPGVSTVSPGDTEPPTPGSFSATGSEVAARGVPSMTDPRTDRTPAGKARLALRRWRARERRARAEESK
jgi:hypothetical protein